MCCDFTSAYLRLVACSLLCVCDMSEASDGAASDVIETEISLPDLETAVAEAQTVRACAQLRFDLLCYERRVLVLHMEQQIAKMAPKKPATAKKPPPKPKKPPPPKKRSGKKGSVEDGPPPPASELTPAEAKAQALEEKAKAMEERAKQRAAEREEKDKTVVKGRKALEQRLSKLRISWEQAMPIVEALPIETFRIVVDPNQMGGDLASRGQAHHARQPVNVFNLSDGASPAGAQLRQRRR